MLIFYAMLGIVVKPMLIIKYAEYTLDDVMSVFVPCFKVLLISVVFPIILLSHIGNETILNCLIIVFVSILSVFLSVWCVGLKKSHKEKIVNIVRSRFRLS